MDSCQRVVHLDIGPVAVRDPHPDRRVEEERLGPAAFGRKLALELFLAGDVDQIAVHVELAVVGPVDDSDVAHPHLVAVSGADAVLDRHAPVTRSKLVEGGEESRQVLGRDPLLPEVRRREIVLREAEERLDLRTDEHRP